MAAYPNERKMTIFLKDSDKDEEKDAYPDLIGFSSASSSSSKLNDYTVEKKIGEGAYGQVHLISDVNKNYYAMKTYTAQHRGAVEMFSSKSTSRYEVDLLSRAIHPNIISLLNLQVITTSLYTPELNIIMELAESNLTDKLDKGPIPMELKLKWIHGLMSAMSLLHENGYLHCDIKTDNLLIMKDGTLKVSDPGLSFNKADVHFLLEERFVCGVAYTKAPEYLFAYPESFYRMFDFNSTEALLAHLPKYDRKRTSVRRFPDYMNGESYALGVVILEILYGKTLLSLDMGSKEFLDFMISFSSAPYEDRIRKIANLVGPSNNNEQVIDMIACAIDMNPKRRIAPYRKPIDGYEELNKGYFTTLTLPNGNVPAEYDSQIKENIRHMINIAERLNYTIYQLANAMSLFWYVLPQFYKEDMLMVVNVCLFMIIRRSAHVKLRGSDKFNLQDLLPEEDAAGAVALERLYVKIYRYMNGIIHVPSIGDYSNDGATLVQSFGYYANPKGSIQDYVLQIQSSRESFTRPQNVDGKQTEVVSVASRSEYLSAIFMFKNRKSKLVSIIRGYF